MLSATVLLLFILFAVYFDHLGIELPEIAETLLPIVFLGSLFALPGFLVGLIRALWFRGRPDEVPWLLESYARSKVAQRVKER